ncbi:hypothetical protein PR202_ga20664 [Eleusine coracana subsp. coracana]|uniref:Isopenicillin N synthase-like Fe(2+) 2OG dioxygenase domain-containing protein n=1 Tax=Eleusine coracana subsp. coracana TaxID=191504 RepID=A0AAV5CXQ5_ELECO|nr:hypothetical protein PR202_ga20664 [Eleusine coracana subsp. coracana]
MWKMLMAMQGFNEEPVEAKRPYYTRDTGKGRRVRDIMLEYTRQVQSLCRLELLSEAMGLHRGHLEHDSSCMDWLNVAAHYYPPCPDPPVTVGTAKHSDTTFLTVLLHDGVGGLQALISRYTGWTCLPFPAHSLSTSAPFSRPCPTTRSRALTTAW